MVANLFLMANIDRTTVMNCCHCRWIKKSPATRSQSLYSLAASLDKRRQDMATSIQTQTGISFEEAEKEVELSISRLSDWAARCDKEQGGTPVRAYSVGMIIQLTRDLICLLF